MEEDEDDQDIEQYLLLKGCQLGKTYRFKSFRKSYSNMALDRT